MRPLIISLYFVLSGAAAAPAAEYSRRIWRLDDGLPQSRIQSFAQTPDGYLWIGTSGGLVRFDGARFTVFDRSNTPALRDDSVMSLTSARDGSLWIGTEGGGLARMQKGAFQAYGASEGLTNGFVRTVLEDSHSRLWVGTDRGLFRLDAGRFRRFDGKGAAPILAALTAYEDSSGVVWVGTSFGLFRMSGDVLQPAFPAAVSTGDVTSVLEMPDHELWIASLTGLYRFAAGTVRPDARFASVNPKKLYRDRAGTVWITTATGGVMKVGGNTITTLTAPDPLPDNTALAVFEDAQRNLWIGTQDGLLRLTETTVHTFTTKDGLVQDSVATVCSAPDGTIWIATTSGVVYHLAGERLVRLAMPPPRQDFPGRNIYIDRDRGKWIGSSNQGFLRLDASGARLFNMSAGLRSNGIRDFLQDRDGSIWIASGSGLSHLDGATLKNYYLEDGLRYGGVRALALDAAGDLLVGTDGGLNRVRQREFVRDAVFDRLGNKRVWTILPDPNGVLWLGTRGDGLVRIEGNTITRYTTGEGLPSNSIYKILDDRSGRLWMSSAAGVFSAERRDLDAFAHGSTGTLAVIPYDTDDGMLSSQMNGGSQAAGARDVNGNLWFPSVKGAVRIDPKQLRALPAADVLIESISVDDRPLSVAGPVSIAPGGNRIKIDFTAPNLAAPDHVSFRYMLEGFDKTWIPSLKSRAAYYTNLPPRRYRFRVISRDVARPDRASEASLQFELLPQFYETTWFYAAAVLAFALLVFGVIRFYARQTRARYALVLAERTRLAREMHDTVIQGCVGVSTLLEAFRSMPPSAEAKSKDLVDRAASQIRITVNEAREAVWDLRHSTIENGLTETLHEFVQQVAASEGIAVQTEIAGTPASLNESAGRNLLLVAREAVRNAVMHGAPDRIGVKLQFDVSEVRLEVTDNGRGFSTGQPRVDGHYGIVGMRERVEQSGGTFELHSVPGAGTNVIAILPLKKQGAKKHARA